MRTKLLLGSALAAMLSLVPSAEALKTSVTYRVSIDGSSAGSWVPRNLVMDVGFACRYVMRWRGACYIDEFKAGPDIDCESARRRYFSTGIAKADDQPCNGQDQDGQRSRVILLQGGENSSGRIHGVIQTPAVGDVQILYVRPRS